jgi:hypothetical protein
LRLGDGDRHDRLLFDWFLGQNIKKASGQTCVAECKILGKKLWADWRCGLCSSGAKQSEGYNYGQSTEKAGINKTTHTHMPGGSAVIAKKFLRWAMPIIGHTNPFYRFYF